MNKFLNLQYRDKKHTHSSNKVPLLAHLSMFTACAIWGLMAPIGKDAMSNGITGVDMVSFRVLGGAILFWMTSFFVKKEKVPFHDIFLVHRSSRFWLGL